MKLTKEKLNRIEYLLDHASKVSDAFDLVKDEIEKATLSYSDTEQLESCLGKICMEVYRSLLSDIIGYYKEEEI